MTSTKCSIINTENQWSVNSAVSLPCFDLVVEVAGVPLVIFVAAVLSRGFLPLCVVSHVMLKDAGESHGWQHADDRSQSQHQTHHHAGKIDCTNGIESHWKAGDKEGGGWQKVKKPRIRKAKSTKVRQGERRREYKRDKMSWCWRQIKTRKEKLSC